MAVLEFPAALLPVVGFVQGRAPEILPFHAVVQLDSGKLVQDYRLIGDTTGVIKSRVVLKNAPTSPGTPVSRARVWALRLKDGYKAWEGVSDADGYYSATGLEVGELYQVTAIDLVGELRCTAGGPVRAIKMPMG